MSIESLVNLDWQWLRVFNGSDSLFWDGFMATCTAGLTWLPMYLALAYMIVRNGDARKAAITIGGALACVLLVTIIDNGMVKPWVARPRPLNDPVLGHTVLTVAGIQEDDFSFFSAHAANTASLTVFLCLVVRHRALSIALVCWSLLNGYTRLYLGMHFPLDVLTGFIAGSLIALFVYTIYRWVLRFVTAETRFISSQYTSTGYSLDDVDVVMLVMALTIFFAVLRALVIAL